MRPAAVKRSGSTMREARHAPVGILRGIEAEVFAPEIEGLIEDLREFVDFGRAGQIGVENEAAAFKLADAGGGNFGFVDRSEEWRVFGGPALFRGARCRTREDDDTAKQRQANARVGAGWAEWLGHIMAADVRRRVARREPLGGSLALSLFGIRDPLAGRG